MDEASKLLEDFTVVQQQLPTGYHKFSPNPPLVDQEVDSIPSSTDPTLPLKSEVKLVSPVLSSVDPTLPLKSEVQVVDSTLSSIDPTLPLKSEVKVVDSIPSSIDPTLPLKSEVDTTKVFLISSDYSGLGGISPIPVEPPPSTEVISFDWSRLTRPRLPSYLPFKIIVHVSI
jgi:hypothetical protein